jgi:hypothetical protein
MAVKTTGSQDKNFAEEFASRVVGGADYSWVLEWIEENYEPDDIFEHEVLKEWALDNGFEEAQGGPQD